MRRRSSRTCSRACSTSPRPTARSTSPKPTISPRSRSLFGLSSARFERAKAAALGVVECEPCIILGIDPLATDEQIREAWLRQVKANHPDRLMAQGLPEEAIAMANRKLALINDAYDRLRRERGLVPPDAVTSIELPSPNHAARQSAIVDVLVLHYTELPLEESLDSPARRHARPIASAHTTCWPRTARSIAWCPRIASPGMPAVRTGAAARR